jgi:hypothetical protein
MRTFLVTILLACAFIGGACSRSDNSSAAQPTPEPNLKADADRLQQATSKAAEERRKAAEAATATPAKP